MARALTSTIALFLAAGLGFVGPMLVEPEPVVDLWSTSTLDQTDSLVGNPATASRSAALGHRGDRHHPTMGMLATATAVRASTMASSRPASTDRTLLVSVTEVPRTEGPVSCAP